jgi:signal transduction histidine kinase
MTATRGVCRRPAGVNAYHAGSTRLLLPPADATGERIVYCADVGTSGAGRWAGAATREAGLIGGLALVVFAGALTAPPSRTALDPLGYALLVLPVAAVALRRRLPVPVLLVTSACLLAYQVRGYPGLIPAVPVVVAVYAAVSAGRRWVAIATVAAGFLGVVAADLFVHSGQPFRVVLQDRFLLVGWIGAAAMAAETLRQRRAYLAQVEQRALDAERGREEAALRRAGEERLRIARELHDSLTHSISLIKVQAGVAVHLARKHDQPVPQALVAIQEASGDAMRELRATLAVLRSAGEPDGTGLDRLDELVDRARTAGLPTSVTITGPRRGLPPVVDRTAYRIVQEALTNITRHAGPATATVTMSYGEAALTVQVDDDGRAIPTPDRGATGVGLLGMRERVAALGGTLQAGPRPVGGFTVRAELPLPAP